MSLSVMLSVVLAAAPPVGVVIGKRSGVNRNRALERAALVRDALQLDASTPLEDLSSCRGNRLCLLKAARDRGWTAVVVLETASVLDDALVNVDGLSVDDDGQLLEHVAVQCAEGALAKALAGAVPALRAKLTALLTPPVLPAPPVKTVEPPPVAPAPVVEALPRVEARAERSAVRWVPLAGSLAILATGAVCFGVSVDLARQLRSFSVPEADIDRVAATGQALQTTGLIGLIGGGALGLASVVLAFLWPATPVQPVVSLQPHGAGLSLVGTF